MQDPIADLMAAIEWASALEQEGGLDSWQAFDARLGDIKAATKALRAMIARETDAEVRQEHQRMLAAAKRLHHTLVLAKADAINRTAQDN
jgi:hypothetical protein